MKIGDNVWISHQDIDACGYGGSVNCWGVITSLYLTNPNCWWVQYKSEYGCFIEESFHKHELTLEKYLEG